MVGDSEGPDNNVVGGGEGGMIINWLKMDTLDAI